MTVRQSFLWALGAIAFAVIGALGIWFARAAVNGPEADPGGRILHQLQTVSAALPSDAQVIYRNEGEPKWDSCDGRPGTFGWDSVVIQIHFPSRTTTTTVVQRADQKLHGLGWSSEDHRDVSGATQIGWTRQLDNGSLARAQLTNVIPHQGSTSQEWDFYATAPPVGRQASRC